MVIGKSFVWGHLGKTGGNTTLRLFQLFPELIEYADDISSLGKHETFSVRPVAGKARVLNIRRLPSWVLALSAHRARNDGRPMASSEQMAESTEPDRYLGGFLQGGEIAHWLRVEYLKEDFLDLISQYTEVSEARRLAVQRLRSLNRANYDRDLAHWFSDSQIAVMHENNPLWAEVEQRVYHRSELPAHAHARPN